MGQLVFQATAGGQVALVGPNPSSSFSLNVPAVNGTLVTTGDTGTVTNTMISGPINVANGGTGLTSLTAGYIPYGNGTSALGSSSALFWDSANSRLGINNSSPAYRLDVGGNAHTTGDITSDSGLYVGTSALIATGSGYIQYLRNISGTNRLDSYNYPITATAPWNLNASLVTFQIADSEKMRLDASGNLGLGTTTTTFTYNGSSTTTSKMAISTAGYDCLNLISTSSYPTLDFSQPNSASTIFRYATVGGQLTTTTAGSESGALTFSTSNAGANVAERMRVDQYGHFLIGTPTNLTGNLQVKNSDGGYGTGITLVEQSTNNYWCSQIYTVTHDLYFGYNGTNKGYFSSSTGAYTSVSDKSLKKDILPINYGLNEILALKPSSYLMNEQNKDSVKNLGFIAQDTQSVIPEIVKEMNDGKLGIEATGFIPVLVKAIQEQQAIIETLTTRLTALENK